MATSNDLTLATRELFVRTVKRQVYMQTPFLEQLLKRNKVKYSGGKYIERLVDKDEVTELGQSYTATTALTDGKKDVLGKPRFTFKLYQMPLRYDVDEYLQNITSADKEIKLLDMAKFLVEKGQRGVRLGLQRMIFNVDFDTGSGSETGRADNSKYFQSLLSALDHDVTYGTLTRTIGSTGVNDYWQGADPAGRVDQISSSSQDTNYNMSISNLRKWLIPVYQYMEQPNELYIMMCSTLFNKLRAELEAYGRYDLDKDALHFGIQKIWVDGHQVVSVPWLEHGYGTSGTTENWVFILNLRDWELRIHTARNFEITPFEWDGKHSNGYDYWLARIMLSGNLICWKPNGSMWLSNIT